MTTPADVVVYLKPWCPYCIAARGLLDKKGVAYEVIDLTREPDRRDEMESKSQRSTVPQIFIGERHIGGFDDLDALERRGELDALLA